MEVKIGVQNAARELSIDTVDDTDAVHRQIDEAVKNGGVLSLSDAKGRTVLVPAEKLAYVEISTTISGTVGFRS